MALWWTAIRITLHMLVVLYHAKLRTKCEPLVWVCEQGLGRPHSLSTWALLASRTQHHKPMELRCTLTPVKVNLKPPRPSCCNPQPAQSKKSNPNPQSQASMLQPPNRNSDEFATCSLVGLRQTVTPALRLPLFKTRTPRKPHTQSRQALKSETLHPCT